MKTKKTEPHPFFCHVKKCRKTFYNTPEYLNNEDISFMKKVVFVLDKSDAPAFSGLLWGSNCKNHQANVLAFFNRVLGWPEGYSYCRDFRYLETTAMPGIITHNLEKMKKFLENK